MEWPEYTGPIEAADGTRPSRDTWFLWPTEIWLPEGPLEMWRSRYRIAIIALADGRWATDGHVYAIESGIDCYRQRCVYPTRSEALRASAARAIRIARYAYWKAGKWDLYMMTPRMYAMLVGWAREVVAREIGRPGAVRGPFVRREETPAEKAVRGLPLFEAVKTRKVRA